MSSLYDRLSLIVFLEGCYEKELENEQLELENHWGKEIDLGLSGARKQNLGFLSWFCLVWQAPN